MKKHSPYGGVAWKVRTRKWRENLVSEGAKPAPLRDSGQFTVNYRQRIERALARHFSKGGKVVECFFDPRCNITWAVGVNCFIEPAKSSPAYLAEHVANRMLGFGWTVKLLPGSLSSR